MHSLNLQRLKKYIIKLMLLHLYLISPYIFELVNLIFLYTKACHLES